VRAQGFNFIFAAIGDGRVVRSVPPESLIPVGETALNAPATPSAVNLLLHRGFAQGRPGYTGFSTGFGAATNIFPITGLFTAVYPNGTTRMLMGDKSTVWEYDPVDSKWKSRSSGVTIGATDTDYWTFAMMRASGGGSILHLCNGVDRILTASTTAGSILAEAGVHATLTGARLLLPHLGRALACNVKDGSGARRPQRVQHSIVGDPGNYVDLGSGFFDLDNDAFPITAGTVMGGRVVLYKGDAFGGSIEVLTPTGVTNAPYRRDTVTGTGILCPRTLRVLNDTQAFFVGHDGFYLHDGARGVLPVGEEVSRDIIPRINVNAYYAAFSFYIAQERLLILGLPVGGSPLPNEYWAFDTLSRKFSGPLEYGARRFQTATRYTPVATTTWDTPPDGTWDSNGYGFWDSVIGQAGIGRFILADASSAGSSHASSLTYELDLNLTTDLGAVFNTAWYSPAITPLLQPGARQQGERRLDPLDELTLHTVTIKYRDTTVAWTPVVEASLDEGVTWNPLTMTKGATTLGGSGTQRILAASFEHEGLTGSWHQVRVRGDGTMKLHTATVEFTYAGSARNAA
jgi:hypothetical protein